MMRAITSSVSTGSKFNLGCWMCRQNFPQSILSSSGKKFNNFRGFASVLPPSGINNVGVGGKHFTTPLLSSPSSASVVPKQQLITRIGNRSFTKSSVNYINMFTPRDDTTLWGKTLKKLGFTEIPKSVLRRSGVLMYMKVADEVDYLKFFKVCNLPDTFTSWFTVLELHVWLISTRLMQDGKEGRVVRNALMKAMWEDCELKSKRLEGALPSARRKDMRSLSDQFQAVIIGYDEGLLGDDHILAGALWRRFLRFDIDFTISPSLLPEHFTSHEKHRELAQQVKALEMLVIYVRSQFVMLNGISREPLLRKQAFTFAPFDDTLYQLVANEEKTKISGATNADARRIR